METADARLELAEQHLFGIDMDATALDMCALTLLGWCLEAGHLKQTSPANAWRRLRGSLYQGDSSEVAPSTNDGSQTAFDFLRHESADNGSSSSRPRLDSFDIVIANPPFSQNGQSEIEGDSRRVAYAPFMRMLWHFTTERGVGAIVLPLSLAYSDATQIESLRREMEAVGGTWQLAFFDRTPDSLFGDDVKTRATIAFFDRDGCSGNVFTTRLVRWNSRDREQLFSRLNFVSVPADLRSGILPKLGNEDDVQLYRAVRTRIGSLCQGGVRSLDVSSLSADFRSAQDALLIAGTAYNFLSVRPLLGGADDMLHIGNTWRVFLFASPSERWGALALLSSRLVYWLWAVEQDGFHVNQGFILGLPFTSRELQQLETLGKTLWDFMRARPVRSVNKGRTTVSYSPVAASDTLDEIDSRLLRVVDQPTRLVAHLRSFQREMLLAGRTHHERLSHHFNDTTPAECLPKLIQ